MPDSISGTADRLTDATDAMLRQFVPNEWVLNRDGVMRKLLDTVKARKLAYDEETRELPGERNTAMNNARCTQARKTTHGLDGQHKDVDRTLRGRVNQNDREQG